MVRQSCNERLVERSLVKRRLRQLCPVHRDQYSSTKLASGEFSSLYDQMQFFILTHVDVVTDQIAALCFLSAITALVIVSAFL